MYKFEYTETDIKSIAGKAIRMLFKNDAFLLEAKAHERSVSHKLAEYLQMLFSDYHVDCEYNRHGIETKLLPRQCSCDECKNKSKVMVYPDIVVHIRGTDEFNTLVIEMKLKPELDMCDELKLQLFTKNEGKYHYRLGLFLGFNGIPEFNKCWFKNGQQISSSEGPTGT